MQEENSCHNLLLTSLTSYYNKNPEYKIILNDIIEGKHKLSLRLIDWLVTHYSKVNKIYYWIHKKNNDIYLQYPSEKDEIYNRDMKKVNIYLDYRAQLKSYAKINFDSFRRHNRITFILDEGKKIETTIGQLNFFRWTFNNKIIEYTLLNYNDIYNDMIDNNIKKKKSQKEK